MKVTPRILADYDIGTSKHTHQKGIREYGLIEGIIARIRGVGVSVKFLDPMSNTMKWAVVNKQSLEDYCARNGVVVDGKNAQQLTDSVNGMLSKIGANIKQRSDERTLRQKAPLEIREIVFTKNSITMTVGELKKFFQELQKHGMPDQAKMLNEIAGSKGDNEKVTLTTAHLNILKGPADAIYKRLTAVKHDVEEAQSGAKEPASLEQIKAFKFDQQKVEQRLKQLVGSDCKHILDGGLESQDRAVALLEKISPKKAEREKLINNPQGVVKDMNPAEKKALRDIINKAGHVAKF